MAFGMRKWIAGVGIGMLLISFAGLPPIGFGYRYRQRDRTPEREESERLLRRMRSQNRVLQRLQWTDSLLALAEQADPVTRLAIKLPEEVPEPERANFLRSLENQVATLVPRAESIVVGLAQFDITRFGHTGMAREGQAYWWRNEVYLGTADSTDLCAVVAPYTPPYDRWENPNRRFGRSALSVCSFVASYGRAGSHVDRWLFLGGNALALDRRGAARTFFGWNPRYVPAPARGFLGRRAPQIDRLSPWAEACLGGDSDSCASTFLRSDTDDLYWDQYYFGLRIRGPSVPGYLPAGLGPQHFSIEDEDLLGDLERVFGKERFARFWTSELPVEGAFQAAFGVEVGAWVMEWGRARFGEVQATPRMDLGTVLWSLLAMAGAAGAAMLLQTYREQG